jgi:hypothetical protein
LIRDQEDRRRVGRRAEADINIRTRRMAVGWADVDDVAQLTASHIAVSCARP